MAQSEPVYEELADFLQIADKIIEKYPDKFGDIDASKIACVSIQNKERSEKKMQIWEVKSVKPPISLFSTKDYIFVFHQKDWDELADKHRTLIVADCLCSIPPGGGGDVVSMDYKDHSMMLRTLGVDYMQRNDVPDILETDIDWKE